LLPGKGEPVFHQSYGLGYYKKPDTWQNDLHYAIAPVTKMITSFRILQLVGQKKIRPDQPLTDYLPSFERLIAKEVTVHHILLHISGLPNEKDGVYRHPLAPEQLVRQTLEKQKSLFIGIFRYNNLDYMLPGLLVEKITGESCADNIRKYILPPLQMDQTGFLEYGHYPEDFAYTCQMKGKTLKQDAFYILKTFIPRVVCMPTLPIC
jgi:CubicO group peptidase (beta-lactamase class C family)